MKIRALNEPEVSNSTSAESSHDDARQQAPSKEALEEQFFEQYKQALLAIQEFRHQEARELLQDLNDELEESNMDGDAFVQLKYSVLKNLGNIDSDNIDCYIKALSIDATDISLWLKAGDRGVKFNNLSFARMCYEQALKLNSSNWVAIDRLIEVYYVLHLPFELHDICMRALAINPNHQKAKVMLLEAKKHHPSFATSINDISLDNSLTNSNNSFVTDNNSRPSNSVIDSLQTAKNKRRSLIQDELQKVKRTRLGINLDTARTQSLSSFGNYIIKIYDRFAKQGITYNTTIDITLNNVLAIAQINNASITSQSNNQNSSDPQTNSSQDIEMAIVDGDGTSVSDPDKLENRADQTNASNDDNEQSTRLNNSRSRSQTNSHKSSSLSFAAMLFPMDLGDKRRSSRNRSNQDDTFSFKMKFDELNELLPECLRIGAIEQALQKRRELQQKSIDELERVKREESRLVETNLEPVREDLIIKDIMEAISSKLESMNSSNKSDIRLCDILYLYLSKLSDKKQNALPEAYLKLYNIYRKLCPLPNGVFIEIGPNGISIEELWFTLSANELSYKASESQFLLRLLHQLGLHLDDTQYKGFLVRLFLVLGSNFHHRYLHMALENIEEDTRVYATNRKIITRAYVKTLIDKSNVKLQQESNDPNDSIELINKLAPKSESEMSEREISSLCSAIKSTKIWSRGLDILNQRNDLNSDVIIDTINICLKNGAKMDAILASKLCKDAISGTRPTTWTCLFRGWSALLTHEQLIDEETVEKMDKFFELGHQTIGKKGTCTADNGEFLMLYVRHLLEDRETFEERELLGGLNCLFNYPNKKLATVASHKSARVPVLWEYADVLYTYLAPEELPTYMSLLRKVGISSEVEPLLKEIAAAVPPELNPAKNVKMIEDYIDKGAAIKDLEPKQNDVTKDIYYFLADYYFKNKDFTKAKQYYNLDLAINPARFDSWAASGLLRANGIDKALSDGTVTTCSEFLEGPFQELADSAIRCLDRATKLKPDESKATLWIEFGNLTYNLTSLAARLFIYDEFESEINQTPLGDMSKLESRHSTLYKMAKNCFKSANTLCHSEEVWLQYYMLGKIYEKVDAFRALEYYLKADRQLFLEGATYPKKIPYHNTPDLAYEAMEVHYRIHTSIIKFLLTVPELTQDHMDKFKRVLLMAQRSPFVEMEDLTDPHSQIDDTLDKDVRITVGDMVDGLSARAEFDELVYMCLHGIKRCLIRCDKNFKALYRLSYYYQKINNPAMAQDILIAREITTDLRIDRLVARKPDAPEFQRAPPDLRHIDSLFKDRKMGNLFFNIWRIPVEEVDRPGCFEHWMFKNTWLLIKTCVDLNDTNMLMMIAFQLSRQPGTSKKYLQDKPRVLLGIYAVNSIVSIVNRAIRVAENAESKRFYIREGLAMADKFIKANVFADRMRDLFNKLQSM